MTRRALSFAAVALAAAAAPMAVLAQADSYPDRPIHFVVPYNPGGTVDPTARIIANGVSEALGAPVVIENRAGAAGTVGADFVVRSDPDGYTVLVHTNLVATEPCLKKGRLPYNFLEQMRPVAQLTETPFVVLVHPDVPAQTLAELVDYAKAHPGELNYGASGVGSSGYMRGQQFMHETGTDFAYIPYKGGGETLKALASGEIEVAFDTLPGSIGLIRDDRLRLLGVGAKERFWLTPDSPTMGELGYSNLASQWIGAFVPAATPDDVVAKLSDAIQKALELESVKKQYTDLGFRIMGTKPAESLENLKVETQLWCDIIEAAGITIE